MSATSSSDVKACIEEVSCVDEVKQALRCDHRACHIVTKDWIEDSISKRRRLPEKPFLLSAAFKEERRKRILQARVTKGIEQAETFVNTSECSSSSF